MLECRSCTERERNIELVRVVFYVIDDFKNPHILRKSYIGTMTKEQYENYSGTCFDVGSDFYAKSFPETITK